MIRDTGNGGGAPNGNGHHREELQYVNSDRISDYYNALFRNVRYRLRRSPACQSIGICSLPGCGQSSVVATNLAICIAQHDSERVLLVNADPSNRVAEVTFSLDSKLGFYDTLWGECDPDEVVQPTNLDNLEVVSCGYIPQRRQVTAVVSPLRQCDRSLQRSTFRRHPRSPHGQRVDALF